MMVCEAANALSCRAKHGRAGVLCDLAMAVRRRLIRKTAVMALPRELAATSHGSWVGGGVHEERGHDNGRYVRRERRHPPVRLPPRLTVAGDGTNQRDPTYGLLGPAPIAKERRGLECGDKAPRRTRRRTLAGHRRRRRRDQAQGIDQASGVPTIRAVRHRSRTVALSPVWEARWRGWECATRARAAARREGA